MKLAWLCYTFEDGREIIDIEFSEPHTYRYHKVVPIVYAEIKEH